MFELRPKKTSKYRRCNYILNHIDPFFVLCFRTHDWCSDFLAQHMRAIKKALLVIAYISLAGAFFPDARNEFGKAALAMLTFLLFLSPIADILRMRFLRLVMGLRRECGILMACFATAHVFGFIMDPLWTSFVASLSWPDHIFSVSSYLLFGLVAYFFLLPLWLTSNNIAMRALGGKKWKVLHRLIYGIFVAAVLHYMLRRGIAAGGDIMVLLQSFFIFFTYAALKFLAWRNVVSPLRTLIAVVATRYDAYVMTKKDPQRVMSMET